MIGCLTCLDVTLGLADSLYLLSPTPGSDPERSASAVALLVQQMGSSSTEARCQQQPGEMPADGADLGSVSRRGSVEPSSLSHILAISSRYHGRLIAAGEHPFIQGPD